MNRMLASLTLLAWMFVCLADTRSRADYPAVASIPMLPDAIDSFGAAEHDRWLYVYGGHQGNEDDQQAENLSQHFIRCHSRKPDTWEELPFDKPLQNLALVSCEAHLYRMGGLGKSDDSKTQSLESVSDFARFDPTSNEWQQLPALPARRSAHDAIAADGKIYVIGGCHQIGDRVEDWHDTALMYDTSAGDKGEWQSLPTPSFRRRNLAVACWQNCIWAIGGKDDEDQATRSVYCFDPQRGYWSEGPELSMQPEGLQGFGVAAWGLNSGLYVSGADGALYRLTNMYGDWERVSELRVQRFCHRLLPDGERALLAVAGYSVSFGQTRSVERIKVYSP
jgi:N-acetylneuraminic acid mutarotase